MGLTYANIQLQNGGDFSDYLQGRISETDIRRIDICVVVNNNSVLPTINESTRKALGLPIIEIRNYQFRDGKYQKLPVVGSIIVKYLDRWSLTNAILVPDSQLLLLGNIPMSEMDLYVHQGRNELLPVHPDGPLMSLK